MRQILICLILFALLIIPASATVTITAEPLGVTWQNFTSVTSVTYDASTEGNGIQRIGIDAPIDTQIDFTLYYGNGTAVSGHCAYTDLGSIAGLGYKRSHIDLGGVESTYDYAGTNYMGRFYVAGYAVNTTETTSIPGFVIFGSSFGTSLLWDDIVFYPRSTGSDGVIYKVVLTSNKMVNVAIATNPRTTVASQISKSFLDVINEWVGFAVGIATSIYELVTGLLYWIKFFFVDNLVMTVALYLTLTMVFAARAAHGNMPKFFRQWFSDQKKLFEFIIGLWRVLVEIVATFRGIFRI